MWLDSCSYTNGLIMLNQVLSADPVRVPTIFQIFLHPKTDAKCMYCTIDVYDVAHLFSSARTMPHGLGGLFLNSFRVFFFYFFTYACSCSLGGA